jgi:hypothetical protein
MKLTTRSTVVLLTLTIFAICAFCLRNPLHAQAAAPATPPPDELVRYGPLVLRSKDIACVTHEETKKVTTVYMIPAAGQPPLKIEFGGDDSMEAWKQLQQPPTVVPTKPVHP